MGRIVISTGLIKTHSSKVKPEGDIEWEIKTGKEAILIEDAHPTIELSRKKKEIQLHFKPPTAGEKHVICFVEKVGFEPRTLGY